MKRFSAREFVLLCLPVAVVAGVGFWAARHGAPDDNGIAVVAARKVAVSPANASKGANVMARIQLGPNAAGFLRKSRTTNWKTDLRVRAGKRLVWSKLGKNTKPLIMVWGLEAPNTDYLYEASFDLTKVPADWGEVVLEWDAELRQNGHDLGRDWKCKSQHAGTVVLRRAGETIPKPNVSTKPHIKLVSSEIRSDKAGKNIPIYVLTLKFERDDVALRSFSNSCDFSGSVNIKKQNGKFSSTGGSSCGIQSQDERYQEIFEVVEPFQLSPNATIEWEANQGNYWLLRGSIPLADAKGKILLGKKQYP